MMCNVNWEIIVVRLLFPTFYGSYLILGITDQLNQLMELEVSTCTFFTRVLRIFTVLTGLRTYEAILTDLLKKKKKYHS